MKIPARYKRISQKAQAGGFGSVTPLEDTFLRRVVLLKSMHKSEHNEQILNEIKGLCAARSRHVVEIYDVIENEGGVEGVIIERLRGRGFEEFWKEAQTSPLYYLRILCQIASALESIHAVGIVHRDLKLDNFRESSAGVLKIFDFGISSPSENHETKQNKGTLIYAAPELYVSGAQITKEMDIYALGICAWTLATQTLPSALLERPPQSSERARSISNAFSSPLHPEVANILDACLEPNPNLRPSAGSVCKTLSRHLLRDKHKGMFVQKNATVFELSAANPFVKLTIAGLGAVSVRYDGLEFSVTAVEGNVRVNNVSVAVGNILHTACLLSFGSPGLGSGQQWVTFFSSHPEVVL
ncbi:protein kinase [Sphingomonas sp. NCPPB 2930]